MPRHFGPQHIANGYAAMGNARRRPKYPGTAGRSVSESIAAERARDAAERKRSSTSKKK